ncbi:MAG TPA: hypothetical protein DDZ76_13790 [Xanthomonadales bacterium]|nr:hypothetical protein [Xanthomonadales bacterium]
MTKSILFGVILTGVDIIAFFFIYLFFSLFARNFQIAEAFADSGLAVLSRFLYLQIFIQILLLLLMHRFSLHQYFLAVVSGILFSYLLTMLFVLRDFSGFFYSFSFSIAEKTLGPGLALLASSLIATLIVQRWLTTVAR